MSLRHRYRTLVPVLVLAASALHAPNAAAEQPASHAEPSSKQRAAAHFERALERYDTADYPLALAEFRRAYALQPSYQLLFNIGQVQYQLGQYARARVALQRYLAQGRGGIESERRAQVEQQLTRLRSRTAELSIVVNLAGAAISVNEEPSGASPLAEPMIVEPGAQHVVVSKPGYSSARSTVSVTGGEVARVSLTLRAASPGSAAEPESSLATLTWIGAGALAVGAIGTGLATVFASRRYDEARRELLTDSPASARAELDDRRSSISALATTTDILALGSLAAAGLALYFTLRTPSSDDGRGEIQARVDPSGIYTWLEF
jgi:hypothetical protein